MNRLLRVLLIATVAITRLAAADGPTKDEWDPVKTAIESKDAGATAALQAITARYPKWPEGWRELARVQAEARDFAACLASTERGLAVMPGDHVAATLAVQALVALNRAGDSLAISEPFTGAKGAAPAATAPADAKGWVHYQAATAASALDDPLRAEQLLTSARARAGASVPAAFHFLDGRLALRKQPPNVQRAELSFSRAVSVDDRLWDGWYELGRVLLVQADDQPARRGECLGKAQAAFERVTKALPKDHESWLGLGRSQLQLGWLSEGDGDATVAGHRFNAAEGSLKEALLIDPTLIEAHAALGEALLKQQKYEAAVAALKQAQALGLPSRSLIFNLATALQHTGGGAEAKALLEQSRPESPGELVTAGMASYQAGDWPDAALKLDQAAQAKGAGGDLLGAILRYLGHARWNHANALANKDAAAHAGDISALRDQAAAAWRQAGDLGDRPARDHFLAVEAAHADPVRGYRAGFVYLGWHAWLSPAGWKTVVANYGASRAWDNRLHQIVWGVLLLLILVLWLRAVAANRRERAAERARREEVRRFAEAHAAAGDAAQAQRALEQRRLASRSPEPETEAVPKAPRPGPRRRG